MANAFQSLKSGGDNFRLKDPKEFAISAAEGHGLGGVLQYPLGLGGEYKKNWNAGGATDPLKAVPFTLFMPYKRNFGFRGEGVYSIKKGDELYTTLPSPDFAIALPTPQSALKTTYNVEYSEFEISQAVGSVFANQGEALALGAGVLAAVAKGAAARTAVIGALGADRALGGNLGKAGVQTAGDLLIKIASVGQAGEGTAQVLFGRQNNPYTENVFKNVKFREHQFSYVFMPRNRAESETIDNIISVFKYVMLPRPQTATEGIFFEFPYEFQIVHSIQNTTFTLLPSVLESMTVDFGGGTDSLKLFVDSDRSGKNYPSRITLEMTFKEMVLLNRDRVANQDFDIKDEGAPPKDGRGALMRFRF